MAAATNLMSVNNPKSVSTSTARTSSSTLQRQIAQKYKNPSMNSNRNFEKVFDKVNENVTQVKDNYDTPVSDKKDPTSAVITTSAQGQSNKNTQDAPQKETQSIEKSADIEDLDETDEFDEPSQAVKSVYMMDLLTFTAANAEIADSAVESDGGANTNLMTILPQSQEVSDKNQSMLNLLSGRTWQVNQQEPAVQSVNATEILNANKNVNFNTNLNANESVDLQFSSTIQNLTDMQPTANITEPQILPQNNTATPQLNLNFSSDELKPVNQNILEQQSAVVNLNTQQFDGLLNLNNVNTQVVKQTTDLVQPQIIEQISNNELSANTAATQSTAANVNDLQAAVNMNQPIINNESTQNNQLVQPQQTGAGQQNAQPTIDVSTQQPVFVNTNETQQQSAVNQNMIQTVTPEVEFSENLQTQVQTNQPLQQTQTIEEPVQSFTSTNNNETQTPQTTVNPQSVNLTAKVEVQPEQVQQNVPIAANQNQSAQPVTYEAVRPTVVQTATEQQQTTTQPVSTEVQQQVNVASNGESVSNNIQPVQQPQVQNVNLHQNQQVQITQPTQQNEVAEMPQAQAVTAEVQLNNRQQNNQLNLNNLLSAEAEINEETQVVTPNQSAQLNQNQQNSNSNNLQSNVQQTITNKVTADESNQTQTSSETFANNLGIATNNLNNSQQPTTPQQVEQAQQAANPQDEFNITGQIVEHARMIRSAQNTEMVIHLKPEHLGELTLRVSVTSNGSVNASFHSDNAAVRAMIENTIVHLKQELANQGLKVDSVQVYSGLDGNLMHGRGQQAWQQNQQGSKTQQGRRINNINRVEGGEPAEIAAAATPVNNVANADGVDYRV